MNALAPASLSCSTNGSSTVSLPLYETALYLLEEPIVCSLCREPFKLLAKCPKCDGHWCEECFCNCDQVSEQQALAVANQVLWRTTLTPAQTMLVQDEHGVV